MLSEGRKRMRIMINYEASWRNSFLDPTTSNNEKLPPKGRNFIASITTLNKRNSNNYIPREVTKDTVMGVLNRLIGDQRKLYQARSCQDYFFKEIESKVAFDDKPESVSEEMVYIRNTTGNTDKNSYAGMIKSNDPIFTSDYSAELWGVLALSVGELSQFILYGMDINKEIELNPLAIVQQLESLSSLKPLPKEGNIAKAHDFLANKFPEFNGINAKGLVLPTRFYYSALYLQLERLSGVYDVSTAKSKRGGLSGISKNNFTKKNFMGSYTTGGEKRIWGNPYIYEEFVKGEGKVKHLLKKASGKLEINLDIERDQAKELNTLIRNAGVSSFYLGKKGLAYVSDIRI